MKRLKHPATLTSRNSRATIGYLNPQSSRVMAKPHFNLTGR